MSFVIRRCRCWILLLAVALSLPSLYAQETGNDWIEAHRYKELPHVPAGTCTGQIGALPEFTVATSSAGSHLVRVSLPFAPAAFPAELGLTVSHGDTQIQPDVRILTMHPGTPASVRRAMVTFPYTFKDSAPVSFSLSLSDMTPAVDLEPVQSDEGWQITFQGNTIVLNPSSVRVSAGDEPRFSADLIAPECSTGSPGLCEIVEAGNHYLWARLLVPDESWPRIMEVQMDSLGTVAVRGHLQRRESGDAYAPDFGWRIRTPRQFASVQHSFREGQPIRMSSIDGSTSLDFPRAPFLLSGSVEVDDSGVIEYLRATPEDKAPFQEFAWRQASFVLGNQGHTPRNALLEPVLTVQVPASDYNALYGSGSERELALWNDLGDLRAYTRYAIAHSAALGHDFGNVTAFTPGQPAPVYGMNRLNHCAPMFAEACRSGDAALRDTAVQWCDNFHDLSIWWGKTPDFGGTRYNNAAAAGQKEHEGDQTYMWRTNGTATFCTKGFDAFFYAYEETGDPRMLAALRAQIGYAREFVHADEGEARNIGVAEDFMHLYRYTKDETYHDEAMRLFREIRDKTGEDNLFSQSGAPIAVDGPFIDDDAHGYEAPYAKPYIIGYALGGLPDLLRLNPDEPRLRDIVGGVADFLADTVDPAGGWRYPHPASSYVIIHQGMEHAAQLVHAASVLEEQGEDVSRYLDAIETVLQARVNGFRKSGALLAGLQGWERSTGALEENQTLHDLYAKPSDRDPARDYTEGVVGVGGAPPDGTASFTDVLEFYLDHRPAERLFNQNPQLAAILERVTDQRLKLEPQEAGSYLRISHPSDPSVGFTLWAPEWLSFPALGYGPEELGGMALDWQRDGETGGCSYTIDRPDGVFTAVFIPHTDYVECFYTVWPKPEADVPDLLGVGPCLQLKDGVFEGDDADMLRRISFLSGGAWTSLKSCAAGNPRNVQFIDGEASPEMTGAMAEGGWRTIQTPRPDVPLITCVSQDGLWVAGTAAEFSNSICNNANASHRCIHSQGAMPLAQDTPTTLRVHVYLMKGSLDDLRERYVRDAVRWKDAEPAPPIAVSQTMEYGLRKRVPAFRDKQVQRLDFPLAWQQSDMPFDEWRETARRAYLETLSTPPPRASFEPQILATEQRDGYVAHKLALNLSTDARVKAYLLVPEGPGPFPGIVALHDHGAHFSIGKEKIVRPFDESQERLDDAAGWVEKYYGNRYIGDELARRGYVVFAADALFWGDRGRFGGVEYEDQQALAGNIQQLGMSLAGIIVWDDVRSAEFLQGLPEVDPDRIGCLGLSMGANRTWHLSAATDIVKCGAAICWMGDTPSLTAIGNNQTVGQSAYSMLHPGLRGLLDYPDVAAIACPKPMLFHNGTEDSLFPVEGVERAYSRMREVWEGQDAGDRLVTKLWPVPHLFNIDMQEETFAWLDKWLK